MRFNHLSAALFGFLILAIMGNSPAGAGPIDLYHLGEADPGAMAGNIGDNPTVDSGPGATDLTRFGTPTYSSNVAAPGSTLSMAFNGTTDYYLNPSVLTTRTTDVGISAWIYPTVANVTASIVYNGNSSANGFGLYEYLSSYGTVTPGFANIIGLLGGVTLGPNASIPLNEWSEVTQLLVNGQDELFVDGILTDSMGGVANTPSGIFGIGGHGSEYFTGNIDEVDLFTTPEPSSLVAFCGLAAMGLLLFARRRKV